MVIRAHPGGGLFPLPLRGRFWRHPRLPACIVQLRACHQTVLGTVGSAVGADWHDTGVVLRSLLLLSP
eukprot:9196799-Alexandrium_andersonii.AAC.1